MTGPGGRRAALARAAARGRRGAPSGPAAGLRRTALPHGPARILLPFSDDSTLIFARRMEDLLARAPVPPEVEFAWFRPESVLSYRQMVQWLPEGRTCP